MNRVSYPRRQRRRRVGRAVECAFAAVIPVLLAGLAVRLGLVTIALALLLGALACAWRSRTWARLARRSATGARSEDRVRRELRRLERAGWRIRHSLRWHGGGDVDHVAIAPTAVGLAFAIETKTRTYAAHDLARISSIAVSMARRRSGWCRRGAVPVLCLAQARGVEQWEGDVAVLSADRLISVLAGLAGTTPKPRFLR